jgi:transcriptional regulator with XRE-family HTH domain
VIAQEMTDDAVLAELGRRVARARLELNLTQGQLADEAGIARKTVQRIERGAPVTLTAFLRVLRALGLLGALDRAVPEVAPSPVERVKLAGRERRRARSSEASERPEEERPWAWGDETS